MIIDTVPVPNGDDRLVERPALFHVLTPLLLSNVGREKPEPSSANVRGRPETNVVQMGKDDEENLRGQPIHKTRLVDRLVLDSLVICKHLESLG